MKTRLQCNTSKEAKKLALDHLNRNRASAGKPLLARIERFWWSMYGAEWIERTIQQKAFLQGFAIGAKIDDKDALAEWSAYSRFWEEVEVKEAELGGAESGETQGEACRYGFECPE